MDGKLTEQDGRVALQDHVIDRALLARSRYGDAIDFTTMCRILEDREVVRHPTTVVFDAEPLQPGEFAYALPCGSSPSEGYHLFVHPRYCGRDDVLPQLIAYHVVRINYGDIATHEEAELFGATLLGMDVDDYYHSLCRLVDELLARAS